MDKDKHRPFWRSVALSRLADANANTNVDGTGFIDFCEKYLGSILHYSLTSDADVDKRG